MRKKTSTSMDLTTFIKTTIAGGSIETNTVFFRPLLGYCRNVILEVDCGTELERGGDEIIRSSSIGPSKIQPMNDSGGDVLLYMWSTSH